jgi:hypothetical protein
VPDGTAPRARGLRPAWKRIPPGARLVIPTALLVAAVIAGFYVWMKPSRDDRSKLPGRLVCQVQSWASVGVTHPRGNVLQLVVRFAAQPPPSPTDGLTFGLANNGATFAVLTPVQGSDDLVIRNAKKAGIADVRTDKETHAARTAADTVEISLDLTKFGITKGLVSPELTVSSQPNTPAPGPGYAAQICHG